MQPEFIEITAFLRQDRERSVGIWAGELDVDGGEVWVFLPKSRIRYTMRGRRLVTVSLPAWLADKERLERNPERRLDAIEERLSRIERHLGFRATRH